MSKSLVCVTHSPSVLMSAGANQLPSPLSGAVQCGSVYVLLCGHILIPPPRGLMGIKWRRYQATSGLDQFVIKPPDRRETPTN